MNRELIIALDFPNWEETDYFLQKFDRPLFVKVGLELYLQNGPRIIEELQKQDHKIFLDLKLHDIPNTVKKAMKGLARLGVQLVNVHAAGGREMMESALEGLDQGTDSSLQRPIIVAVTQLTSTSQQQMQSEQNIVCSLEDSVSHYANLAQYAGIDGVVCSSREVPLIQKNCRNNFLTITPGIRLRRDDLGDQVRIASPSEARKLGASSIVVGRSITNAHHPQAAFQEILEQWEGKGQ
ncbi:orotidine-5'-phosphate decarboxylase [Bacillus sp. 2205SS5-2]|uniref:orotidine-5'-phosphate decarboxylase n=1 Tax=Bacillus sp. 2205SS5-2 TaxID=3109031 RepID=UPI003005C335